MSVQSINWMEEVLKRKEALLATTQEFLRIKSVLDESTHGPNAPFGKGIADALEFVLDQCKQAGMTTKNVNGYAGHGEFGEGKELLGILSHVDVVPEGDGWTSPPYAAEIVDDKIIARGALDDKGPTIAALFAARIVKELGLPLGKRVRLIFGTDEETSWRCVSYYFEKEEMPTYGFTPDADFPLIYAEKGLTHLVFRQTKEAWQGLAVESKSSFDAKLTSLSAGMRMNMVPDRAEATLVSGDRSTAALAELFQAYLDHNGLTGDVQADGEQVVLGCNGVSVHGMDPEKGINAGTELIHFLHTLALDERAAQFVQFTEKFLYRQHYGQALNIAHTDEEMGPLTLNTGIIRYESDGDAQFDINIRYPHSQPYENWQPTVEQVLGEYGFTLETLDHLTPHRVAPDHPLVTTLQRVYTEQTGQEATAMAIGGATYGRSLDVGVAFGMLFPGRPDCAHQRDEHVFIEDMLKATALYAQAIYELAKA